MAEQTISRLLARHVLGIRYGDLPPKIVSLAKDCIIDQLGVQLRGATLHWTQPVYHMIRNMGCKQESTLVFHGGKTTTSYAAYVNGTFGQSCELDDVGVGGHAGAATVPTSMALGELLDISGKDLIRAVVAGYEAMGRVGDGMMNGARERGFHSQSVNGPFGAVTSAGILLGLDEDAMVNAYGITGSHSCGVTEFAQVGGEVKRAHAGIANRNGVQSALLAKEGLTGPATIFEGKRGVIQAFAAPNSNPQNIITDLDKDYQMTRTTFKPYPTVLTLHAAIDALNMVLAQNRINYPDIREINVGMGPHLVHGGAIYRPTDVVGAQFSLAFSFGLRLVTGKSEFEDYENPMKWVDPNILRIADLVKPYSLPEAINGLSFMAKVQIKLVDGSTFEALQQYSKGSPENPLTPAELEAKFRMLAHVAVPDKRMDQILEMVQNLEVISDISQLVSLLVGHSTYPIVQGSS
jgi:2-methylcitrate dehydratase PrpD